MGPTVDTASTEHRLWSMIAAYTHTGRDRAPTLGLMPVSEIRPQPVADPPSRRHRDLLVNSAMVALSLGLALLSDQNVLYGWGGHSTALRVADVIAGVVCLAGVWVWRVRRPVAFAVAAIVIGVFSTLAGGVAVAAVFTVAVHRRWQTAVAVSVLAAISIVPSLMLYPVPHDSRTAGVGILGTFAATGWGMFVRARRLLLASLRTQLAQAEEAAAGRAETARRAERERIAREMHDVLAHRLSLLAVHAGALEFRPDAATADVARAAAVIRSNSHEALEELRSVISVLREPESPDDVTRPQPTLADLPALIDESRQAGLSVSFRAADDVVAQAGGLPVLTGRTVYRVVQESLTNVRKHANYSRVAVELAGRVGTDLEVTVRNDLIDPGAPDAAPAHLPGSGSGLIGLRERVTLAGGRLDAGATPEGQFVVRARLPWPAATTGHPVGLAHEAAAPPVRA
jgi:signal transduction histidine kinase